jgi:predicted DNA-binding transcriptional regulator YafY
MSTTATRLITLIMLLQDQPNQKAAELAEKLGVSVRTLHRYMGMLDEMGIPVYTERGPYGCFSLVRGYKMPPLVLTPAESVAVALGTGIVEELWGHLYRDPARGALAKLENLLPDEQRHEVAWARKSLIATGMHRSDLDALGETLEKLRRAVRERRRIHMQYQSRTQAEAGLREFDPYAIVHRWGWWYAIGHCHKREAVRTFRVDRIQTLTLLDQAFEVPAEFDIHTYLEQEQAARPGFPVTMRFAAQVAAMASEYAIGWDTVAEQPDGSLVVTMQAPDVMWAVSNALAYGPAVTVLEPEEVRRTVQEWAQAVVAMYAREEIDIAKD